jgi:RHS repeat-associated protein
VPSAWQCSAYPSPRVSQPKCRPDHRRRARRTALRDALRVPPVRAKARRLGAPGARSAASTHGPRSAAKRPRGRHDTWGKMLEDTSPGFVPFGFAGGLYDADTGLVRFGARDYDPSVGRWVSKDPIRFGGRQANIYAYAGDDPSTLSIHTASIPPFSWSLGGSVLAGAGLAVAGITTAPLWVPVGLVAVGSAIIIGDNVFDVFDALTTIDKEKDKLKPVDDYHKKQEEDLKNLDNCQ